LTELYFDPKAGPEVARMVAAHAMGTTVLERHYIDWSRLEYLTGSVLGEELEVPKAPALFSRPTE
jgi:hypothetical protein